MKSTTLLLPIFTATLVLGSWFSSKEQWTKEQFDQAQKSFHSLKDASVFDSWSDSRLREFLQVHSEQPRESLLSSAKAQYTAYTNAAKSYATPPFEAASSSVSSFVAQATQEAYRQADLARDYIFSTWQDNVIKDYLVENGYMKSNEKKKRDEMLQMIKSAYLSATDPAWKAWSDSYIHGWLVAHGIIKSDFEKRRDKLVAKMNEYYYTAYDPVWATWSDSDLKKWLVDHAVIKSDAQVKREKMVKLIESYYPIDPSTVYASWKDSDMRDWLVNHGYLQSDAQIKRDELTKLMHDKYAAASSKVTPYLNWPDARLRAYLIEIGIITPPLTTRELLLQKVRENWNESSAWCSEKASNGAALLEKIRAVVFGGVEAAEDKLSRVVDMIEDFYHHSLGAGQDHQQPHQPQQQKGYDAKESDKSEKKFEGEL